MLETKILRLNGITVIYGNYWRRVELYFSLLAIPTFLYVIVDHNTVVVRLFVSLSILSLVIFNAYLFLFVHGQKKEIIISKNKIVTKQSLPHTGTRKNLIFIDKNPMANPLPFLIPTRIQFNFKTEPHDPQWRQKRRLFWSLNGSFFLVSALNKELVKSGWPGTTYKWSK